MCLLRDAGLCVADTRDGLVDSEAVAREMGEGE